MGQRPKVRRKQKKPKNTDKKQSARFIEAARELDADDGAFERLVKQLGKRRQKGEK